MFLGLDTMLQLGASNPWNAVASCLIKWSFVIDRDKVSA